MEEECLCTSPDMYPDILHCKNKRMHVSTHSLYIRACKRDYFPACVCYHTCVPQGSNMASLSVSSPLTASARRNVLAIRHSAESALHRTQRSPCGVSQWPSCGRAAPHAPPSPPPSPTLDTMLYFSAVMIPLGSQALRNCIENSRPRFPLLFRSGEVSSYNSRKKMIL